LYGDTVQTLNFIAAESASALRTGNFNTTGNIRPPNAASASTDRRAHCY